MGKAFKTSDVVYNKKASLDSGNVLMTILQESQLKLKLVIQACCKIFLSLESSLILSPSPPPTDTVALKCY